MLTRTRVKGTATGIWSGDRSGMPVETYSHEKITAMHGRITEYINPDLDHKYFGGREGSITDDYQQSAITGDSIITCRSFFPAHIAYRHLDAYKAGDTFGWGSAARQAMKNMLSGMEWNKAGVQGAAGNGVVMKLGFVSLYFSLRYPGFSMNGGLREEDVENLVNFTVMTHNSNMAVEGTFTHLNLMDYLLSRTKKNFNLREFADVMMEGCQDGCRYADLHGIPKVNDNLFDRLSILAGAIRFNKQILTPSEILRNFGNSGEGKSAYLYYSLPMTYAFFLSNPHSIESLYDVISAGGDTDTNGSILASMLGALNGMKVFPEHLIKGVKGINEAFDLAKRFSDAFYINR